jgi:hypothetical protein
MVVEDYSRFVGDALVYSPMSGKLIEFLTVLRDKKIVYGTHFNTSVIP